MKKKEQTENRQTQSMDADEFLDFIRASLDERVRNLLSQEGKFRKVQGYPHINKCLDFFLQKPIDEKASAWDLLVGSRLKV